MPDDVRAIFGYALHQAQIGGKHESSGNLYADLGFDHAEEMLLKAQLAHEIARILRDRGLTQARAADVLGIPQPKLSKLLRGQFKGISETKMLECLTRLGRDVQIVIGSDCHPET